MNLGPIRYRVNAKKQAAERSFTHTVYIRETAFDCDVTTSATTAIHHLFQNVWQDETRNHLIVLGVIAAVSKNRQILVLSERTEHLEILRRGLVDQTPNLYVLKGGLGKKQVKAIMQELRSIEPGAPVVILATGRYLGEGFDLPNLDTLFMTFPVSWKGTIAQYAGRLHRDHVGKTEVVINDYADLQVPVLARMHAKRLKGYTALGYSIGRPIGA
jgi:superfamily II DNA or RNA helicase